MFNFTPLLGAQSLFPASQSLLELDGGTKILIDVGWNPAFDVEELKALEREIPTLSIILLTHATTSHLGAFAHCCKHFPLFSRIPVYATAPVISFGRSVLQDLYSSTQLASTFIPSSALAESSYASQDGQEPNILLQPPTPDEIASYFALINPLGYSQPFQPTSSPFAPPLNGLSITAYSAGHTLGGTIWHIQHGLESVVYAVDWNQAKERVIPDASWLGGSASSGGAVKVIEELRRPTALICSSKNANSDVFSGGRKKREELLIGLIKETVANGGSVLIPSDSSARVLELAYFLDMVWREESKDASSPLKDTKLYLATKSCRSTVQSARGMIEWMEEGLVRDFELATQNEEQNDRGRGSDRADEIRSGLKTSPLGLQRLKLIESRSQFNRMLANTSPRVILASDSSLAWGSAKQALLSMAADRRNLVILTERTSRSDLTSGGLNDALWSIWHEKNTSTTDSANSGVAAIASSDGRMVPLKSYHTQAIEGAELAAYQDYLARQRQVKDTLQPDNSNAPETAVNAADDASSASSESSDDSDEEQQGRAMTASIGLSHVRNRIAAKDSELGIAAILRQKGVHDADVRGKKGREKMFPFITKKRRGDDFGEHIRPEEYLRAEERKDAEVDPGDDHKFDTSKSLGQKRKWDEVQLSPTTTRQDSTNKRRKSSDQTFNVGTAADSNLEESSESEESEAEVGQESAGPEKVIFSQGELKIDAQIAALDFSGIHDKQNLHILIPLIKPRKLVLTAGNEDETVALADDCRKLLGGDANSSDRSVEVLTPITGERIDASMDTNAWVVKLSHAMVRKLQWQNVKGLGVVAITGKLDAPPLDPLDEDSDEHAGKKIKLAEQGTTVLNAVAGPGVDSAGSQALPVLDIVPANMAASRRPFTQPLHVGDLRLADLKKIMLAAGFTAEFRGEGVLLVNGAVVVRKTGTGAIEVESGGLGDMRRNVRQAPERTFTAVRRKIYESLAIVAGGR